MSKLRLFHDNSGDSPHWHIDHLLMEDAHTKEQLRVSINRWLSKEKEDGETFREVPVLGIGREPLPGENQRFFHFTAFFSKLPKKSNSLRDKGRGLPPSFESPFRKVNFKNLGIEAFVQSRHFLKTGHLNFY